MIYLEKDDIETDVFTRFIDESTAHDDKIVNRAELQVIGLCKTFLTAYDVSTVFGDTPVRDELLVDIMVKILVYKILSRNAARKISEDTKENYKDAMKMLEKIQAGKITLGLPAVVLAEGESRSIWGNTTNKDNYI